MKEKENEKIHMFFELLLEEFWREFPEFILFRPLFTIEFDDSVETGCITYDSEERIFRIQITKKCLNFLKRHQRGGILSSRERKNIIRAKGSLKEPNPFPILFHEIMHFVRDDINQGVKVKEAGYDFYIWQTAVEYYLKRLQVKIGYANTYHEFFIKEIERVAPKLSEIPVEKLQVWKIYNILLEHKEKLKKMNFCFSSEGAPSESKNFCFLPVEIPVEVLKNVERISQEGKLSLMLMKSYGNGSQISEYVKFEITPESLNIPLEIARAVKEYSEFIKHNFDIPDFISYFPKRIVYPERKYTGFRIGAIIDVSSSMSVEEIGKSINMLSDFKLDVRFIILHNEKVIDVLNKEEFNHKVMSGKFPIGGGTDYTEAYCIAKEKEHEVDLIVHFTDGVCNKPENIDNISHKLFFVLTSRYHRDWITKYKNIVVEGGGWQL